MASPGLYSIGRGSAAPFLLSALSRRGQACVWLWTWDPILPVIPSPLFHVLDLVALQARSVMNTIKGLAGPSKAMHADLLHLNLLD